MESKNQENPDDFIGLIFTYFKEYGTQSEIPLKDSENFVNSSSTIMMRIPQKIWLSSS